MDKFSIYSRFEKGSEVGSNNYNEVKLENSIPYVRVADLNNKSTTFINSSNSKNIAMDDDILIAFDGAPGRNCIGLSGAFSSGIYKVNSDPIYKGLLYFELNSIENQKIIKDYSQGTTILHASKAIPLLKSIKASDETVQYFSNLFNYIVVLKRKMTLLKTCKELLLSKYFTNQ